MTSESNIRTLVVDDSDFFAEMTADTLTQQHGIESVAANSAMEALERLDGGGFDCVVSDYEMPEMDGLELLEEIRETNPSIPFILLTGRGDEETASAAIAAGVADYLLKLEVVEDKQYGRLANRIENVVSQERTRKKFESLVSDSPDGIIHLTTGGTILSANPSMARRLGADPDVLVGQQLSDVMDSEAASQRLEAGKSAVENGTATRSEDAVGGRHYHNQYIPVDSHRKADTFQLVSRDITERVERQRELERQNERLEEFASVVSHDLRNPLNVAQGAIDLLSEPADSEEAELVAKIDRSLDRMGSIIEDVLALARQGQTVSDPQETELSTLASTAWTWIEAEQASMSVESSTDLAADSGRVQDLLANLFRNAIEHNDGDVEIEVGLLESDDGFYIADDGEGVEGDADDVFEMGYSSTQDGTGFGLAIVEQVAEAHGWEVSLTDSDSGGARFEVTGVELHD
ncbi:response regulator [Haloarcula sp. CBA1130]|uniref:response regulator n=1 Tax=unclassified Haloarcula TaxID=2624677 RepID=UPI0012460E1B|nr:MULTISPECIES: response regulator [unclassified Haloarcula]KAA9397062.1 response regulator [Haloarcula sp. CBA1129]KAA9402899.1 response regulator [Haloarcula sp. CBA1130]